ncbi:hypothetical protein A2Z22_01815 [Candidatus Woesebacteria bacterium RBG_16_34_12]|uniref:Glycosyl transferase family 1 domain-containing protein n=1 Tax=Candidatus Woesebacteria bacterium RBG_16_34_12 TaxID=1802480 RepID=A0A1F7X834_9BACT|nr:MAG: hypothetical protein A2Z22_01815 [Candidatus Woesebacteria bacterium RBG_16_34_12]
MKVLHAPENIAGQASMIAKAQRELGIEADVLVFNQKKYNYYCDINLSLSEKRRIIQYILLTFNFIRCFFKYDVFHFHFGFSLLPYNLDLPILKLFGKKIIMHYWGSDIRQSDIAINYVYFKTLDELQKIFPADNDTIKRKSIKRIEKYINISIVGDYQLLPYSPNSIVVKQALEISKFPFIGCQKENNKIIIIHAPSDREKKGTKYVIPAIERLKDEKYNIDFILIENKTHYEATELYKNADIIIDQIVLESHGTLAMEAMALGKPVLCRIDEKFMKYYQGLPLISTDPDNIYDNLKLLIENPDLREELGKKGRKYVEDVHDSKKIAMHLIELYQNI